jgi:predicted DNA-binding protein (MmcQ/YjbR family)
VRLRQACGWLLAKGWAHQVWQVYFRFPIQELVDPTLDLMNAPKFDGYHFVEQSAIFAAMMTRRDLCAYCASLPHTTHVVQWGGSDVYKVGDKLFAVVGMGDAHDAVTFKVSDLAFEVLSDMPGLRPAPYLASRGLKWIQHYDAPGLSDVNLQDHIKASYDMVAAKLTKKKRAELGL